MTSQVIAPPAGDCHRLGAEVLSMPFFQSHDKTSLFYADQGAGSPVVFAASAGMPSDIWSYNLPYLAERGLRCVALDRRWHGRSDQAGGGYTLDTLADDLAALLERLDLRDVTLVGHSLGGAEVVRYLARHGEARVRRAVLVAATTPRLSKADGYPEGADRSLFEATRAAQARDFPKWVADNARAFFTADTSDAMVQWGSNLMLTVPLKAQLDLGRVVEGLDLRADLRAISVPTLVVHGDLDVSVPVALGRATAALVPGGRLEIYEGAAHGLLITHADRLNRDLVNFIKG